MSATEPKLIGEQSSHGELVGVALAAHETSSTWTWSTGITDLCYPHKSILDDVFRRLLGRILLGELGAQKDITE